MHPFRALRAKVLRWRRIMALLAASQEKKLQERKSGTERSIAMKKTFSLLFILGLIAIPLVPGGLVLRDAVGQTQEEVWFVGAGDIADCRAGGNAEASRRTRWLLDDIIAEANGKPVAIFTVGDNSYRYDPNPDYHGAFSVSCYEYKVTDPGTGVVSLKGWGKHKSITYPAPGNHDYQAPYLNGERYHNYFGGKEEFAGTPACRASGASNPRTGPPSDPFSTIQCGGEPGKGWYTFRFGPLGGDANKAWRIIVLNSEHSERDSTLSNTQLEWLHAVLDSEPSRACTLAIWHHPYLSNNVNGEHDSVEPLWRELRDKGADVVISAHAHHYERFSSTSWNDAYAPNGQKPEPYIPDDGQPPGLRQFVVGTGGAIPQEVDTSAHTSKGLKRHQLSNWDLVKNAPKSNPKYGVLLLKLRANDYDSVFKTVDSDGNIGEEDAQTGLLCR